MKKLFYLSIIALLSSCSGSQLFLEARTTYNVPLDNNGQINKNIIESDAQNNPQIRLTYRQYLFDGKKQQIKNSIRKQLKNYNIKQK